MDYLLLTLESSPDEPGIPSPSKGFGVGRGPANDLAVDDPELSRHHATLWEQGGRYYVRDEHSTNGTFINDQRIGGTGGVHPGDRVRMGSTVSLPKERPAAKHHRPPIPTAVGILIGPGLVAVLSMVFILARRRGLICETLVDKANQGGRTDSISVAAAQV